MQCTARLLFAHGDRQGVDMSFTVCLCVCLFVRLRISPPRIKLAASNFARRFIGVQGRESPIFVNFAPRKPKIGRVGQHAGHAHREVNIIVEMRWRECQARDAPFVKSGRRSAYVDTRQSLKTDVLVKHVVSCFSLHYRIWQMHVDVVILYVHVVNYIVHTHTRCKVVIQFNWPSFWELSHNALDPKERSRFV